MKNSKKMTFFGIFLAFLGFCPILGMSRSMPSVSNLPERCDSPDEDCYKKQDKTSSSFSDLSPLEEIAALDTRPVITGEIPPRCTAPALEESPEKCSSPEINLKKKAHQRRAQQVTTCLFQSDAQKYFLAKPEKNKFSSRKQSTALHNPLTSESLPDNNDGDIDESSAESDSATGDNKPPKVPENNEIYLENTGLTVLVSPRSSRDAKFLAQLSQHNSDDDRKTDEDGYATNYFRVITPSEMGPIAEIAPISRLTSQAQSGSSSAQSTGRKSALKQSPTPRAGNKRTVSYSGELSTLPENNEIPIEPMSQTAPVSQRSTPLSMGIPGQVEDEYTSDYHNRIIRRLPKGAFGGFFDPKPQPSRHSATYEFFAPLYQTNRRDPIQEKFQTGSQSAPVSPKAEDYTWLEDIKEESPSFQNETSSAPQSSTRIITHSQSAPVSRPGSAKKTSRIKRMVSCLLLPFTKHKNHSK